MLKQNTAHKATQTIKDTLHTVNTMQKSKAIPATGRNIKQKMMKLSGRRDIWEL
jgi:hypothetical protein